MARKAADPREETKRGVRPLRLLLRYLLAGAAALACAVAGMAGFFRAEEFLVGDRRFALPEPAAYGEECPNVHLAGIEHASRRQVAAVFSPDYGRSVYLIPLAERRRQLLALPWVKEATVRRTWPNRIDVQITERQPVAFIHYPSVRGGSGDRVALIDGEGEILPLPKAKFQLPLLTGILPEQPKNRRRAAVGQVLRMIEDLGSPLAGEISEIDAADLNNLKVSLVMEGRAFLLLLGDRNFRRRLEGFRRHFPEIRPQLEGVSTLDLRIDGRITTVEEPATPAAKQGVKHGE